MKWYSRPVERIWIKHRKHLKYHWDCSRYMSKSIFLNKAEIVMRVAISEVREDESEDRLSIR